MRGYLLFVTLLSILTSAAQRPNLRGFIDSTDLKEAYYTVPGSAISGGDQEVEPEKADIGLLKVLVHARLNGLRQGKRLPPLNYDSSLARMAHYNVVSNSTGMYTSKKRAAQRFSREIRKARKEIILPFGICKTAMAQTHTMDYKEGKYYFFYEEDEELVYGRRSDIDSNFVPSPIQHLTYDALASKLAAALVRANRLEFLSKYHVAMAIQIAYYERSLGRHKVPLLRASVVYGAPRIPIAHKN